MGWRLGVRFRAFWLVCLLAVSPTGVLTLLAGHAPGQDGHDSILVHDPADHAVSAGALAAAAGDRECLFCQAASTLRLGSDPVASRLEPPAVADLAPTTQTSHRLRTTLPRALLARGPPVVA